MNLTNTTKLPNHFLRRMTAWCREQVGLAAEHLVQVDFRNKSYGICGQAWWEGRVMVRFSELYTTDEDKNPDFYWIVFVLAHEIQHVKNYRDGSHRQLVKDRDLEPHCDRIGRSVAGKFRDTQEALVAEWSAEPVRSAAKSIPRDPVVERATKAATDLARWEKKLKLAKTKVKKYKARVAYYAKKTSIQG
jgi:hypothetical protein